MSEAAVLLHQEPEHVLEGPPRGQLPEQYAMLFHPLERIIYDADQADSMAATSVDVHNGFSYAHYRLRAECHGARLTYEIKTAFGPVLQGVMNRADIRETS